MTARELLESKAKHSLTEREGEEEWSSHAGTAPARDSKTSQGSPAGSRDGRFPGQIMHFVLFDA